jgi:hypothetical protein
LRRECGGPAVLPLLDHAVAESDPQRTIGGASEPFNRSVPFLDESAERLKAAVREAEHLRASGHEHAARRARADSVASGDGRAARYLNASETPVGITAEPARRRDPEISRRVLFDARDDIVRQSVGSRKGSEPPIFEAGEAASIGTDPERVLVVFLKRPDFVVFQTSGFDKGTS